MKRYYKCVLLLVLIVIALLSLCANSNVPCIVQEKQALVDFKASIAENSPNKLSSWKGTHCCQWDGIGCDNVTGHVVKLDLRNPCAMTISRQHEEVYKDSFDNLDEHMSCLPLVALNVSSSLLQLKHLAYLDLSGNNFLRSPIPIFMGSMGHLEYLSLYKANFSGMIPNSLGNLKNLQFLNLDYNYHLQISKDTSWISKLHSLKQLDLNYVRLNDTHNLFQVLNLLPSLLRLSLVNCELDNSLIPHLAFQNMTSLVYLDLSWNRFYGSILESFQNITSIESLYLSHNYFTLVPSWFKDLDKLTLLDLSANGLDGQIFHALANLSSLIYLDLSSNRLYDPIPEAFGNMTSIESLYLNENSFTLVPLWFCNFKKLIHLDLSINEIHGPIPEAFRNMTFIESLNLSLNLLTSIPPWLAGLKTLVSLDLSMNQLTLTQCFLSSIITNMCHLKVLYLSQNNLQGEIMGHSELSGCIGYDLEVLELWYNGINDHLPTWLGQLQNLKYIHFGYNFFHGSIPLSLGKLSKLLKLDLSNNALEGVVLNNIGQFVNLTYLDLSSNKFEGSIPRSLGKLENMYYLDLSNNSFNGFIVKTVCQLVNLNYLDISSNKFEGVISTKKGWPLSLWHLSLSHNQFSGPIPKDIGHTLWSLENLLLGNNHLNGSIPTSLCQMQLENLDLSKNKFTGQIPNCWKDSQGLSWLHLNNNSLQGEIPTSFKYLKQLLILDLGENQISGSIPSSWTTSTFPLVQIIRLRQNMLSGIIPSQLCGLKTLKILDLSKNKMQGSIPRCIGNLQGMTLKKSQSSLVHMQSHKLIAEVPAPAPIIAEGPTLVWHDQDVTEVVKGMELEYTKNLELVVNIDLSENKLVGFIPDEITWLTGLHGLSLSRNQLKGEIPRLIGDMKSLESLDMSHNQLSGKIPNSMSAITSLSHLNLSHNNISGPIPKDNQFSTFNDPSIYAYNPYLCGSPLPNMCPGDVLHGASERKGNEDEDGLEKVWFYFVIALGFGTGLWGVIGTLWFKKNWRHAYFRWVEDVSHEIYVAIVIKVAKIKKKMNRNHEHE